MGAFECIWAHVDAFGRILVHLLAFGRIYAACGVHGPSASAPPQGGVFDGGGVEGPRRVIFLKSRQSDP